MQGLLLSGIKLRVRAARLGLLIGSLFLFPGCGGDSPTGSATGSATGSQVNVTGTFIGSYTATSDPGVTYEVVLQLTQSGSQVTGTLATNIGRSANLSGSISGSRITATFTYTDGCGGSASTIADVSSSGTQLSGTYTATDCTGTYAGGYSLTKQ